MNNQPARIAHIIGKMRAGGVEAVVFNYYRAIDHTKFQFDFYYDADSTVEPPQELIDMGAKFIKLPPYQNLPQYIKELRGHLREERYTIVHSHLNTISVFPLYAAWKERIPVRIAHNHSVPGGNELRRNLAKQILRHFSKLFSTHYFACSEKAGRWMFGNHLFDNGKVYVLKNAVDFERFHISQSEVEALKTKLGLSDCFVVGHIGRFTYAKNHQFLLDAFKKIQEKNSRARLLLVGDGELHDEIIEGIRNRRLDTSVVMTGMVQNPEKYYKLNDVIILPSIFEGLSMTTVESQVAGVPIIISKAIPEEAIISDGCIYLDLDDSVEIWSQHAIDIAGKKVNFNNRIEDYDIRVQVKKIEEWYANMYAQ